MKQESKIILLDLMLEEAILKVPSIISLELKPECLT